MDNVRTVKEIIPDVNAAQRDTGTEAPVNNTQIDLEDSPGYEPPPPVDRTGMYKCGGCHDVWLPLGDPAVTPDPAPVCFKCTPTGRAVPKSPTAGAKTREEMELDKRQAILKQQGSWQIASLRSLRPEKAAS